MQQLRTSEQHVNDSAKFYLSRTVCPKSNDPAPSQYELLLRILANPRGKASYIRPRIGAIAYHSQQVESQNCRSSILWETSTDQLLDPPTAKVRRPNGATNHGSWPRINGSLLGSRGAAAVS